MSGLVYLQPFLVFHLKVKYSDFPQECFLGFCYWQNQTQQVFLQAPQIMFSKASGWAPLSAKLKRSRAES